MRSTLALTFLAAVPAFAAERKIPFWPDAVPETIHAAVDGGAVLETVRELSRFHRVQGSPGFAGAAELVRRKAAAAGLADASLERFPADGKTRYAHFLAYLGWEATEAQLDEGSPRPRPMARFPELPVALADYSQDADVTAELVDVGAGVSVGDYEGREVSGRIVLASGALPTVHRMAVEQRGAVGFLSDYPNQTTAWSGDDRDLVRWGHLSPYQVKNTFAFMLSKRQSEALRTRLQTGERIQMRARVKARMVPATYDLVSASIPGSDAKAGEVLLTAHLCHQSAGANDNASGSAAILEVARSLSAAIRAGALPAPRHTIRFLWTPEIAGTQVWMARRSESAPQIVAGIHMDMVGGLLATTRGTLHVSRSAESLPHVVNDVARAFFDEVVAASAGHAERGGDPWAGFVFGSGSREVLLGDIRRVEMGSDHDVLQAAGWGVPTVYFHDWPDVTIHTNKDQPENLDATKLGRVAYMGAGIAYTLAALPDGEAKHLLPSCGPPRKSLSHGLVYAPPLPRIHATGHLRCANRSRRPERRWRHCARGGPLPPPRRASSKPVGRPRPQGLPPCRAGTGVSRFAVPRCAARCSSTTMTTSPNRSGPGVSRTSPFRISRATPTTPS